MRGGNPHCWSRPRPTCLLDVGKLLGDSGRGTESTQVFRKDPEGVGVAHHEVGDGAGCRVVALQHCEPLLRPAGLSSPLSARPPPRPQSVPSVPSPCGG